MQLSEFVVLSAEETIRCSLLPPRSHAKLAQPGLLLTFAGTREAAFGEAPYDIPALLFAEAGHGVVSFDLPQHGERVDRYGAGIEGMCAAFVAGDDPFQRFVRDASAVIDRCVSMGLGAGGIVACGVSRAAYCALRLAAEDARVSAVAGLAPVTDWRRLREFAPVRDDARVAGLALQQWAAELAQRHLFFAIGNQDERVGSDACLALAQQVYAAQIGQADAETRLQFHLVEAAGHTLPESWRRAGAQFLLRHVTG